MELLIDQDLWDLTQRYVLDQLAILKRAGLPTELEPDAYEYMVRVTAEIGQALRISRQFVYEDKTNKSDAV